MPRWKITESSDLLGALERCQYLLEAIDLGLGVVFLNLSESAISDLERIRHLTTLPDYFLCGRVADFDSIWESVRSADPYHFFITVSEANSATPTLSLSAPQKTSEWCLIVSGSPGALELARKSPAAHFRPEDASKFTLLLSSADEISHFLNAAMSDYRKEFLRGRKFSASIHDRLDRISGLVQAAAIVADPVLEGHLGFRPAGAPRTNVDLNRIPELVEQLSLMSSGKIRLSWQILRLDSRSYESYNLLSIVQDRSKSRPASVEVYSLSSVPVGLRKAIEKQLNL